MVYLSDLIHSEVKDSADVCIGTLEDIMIKPKANSYSPLRYLEVKRSKGTKKVIYLPYENVEIISKGRIYLKRLFSKINTEESLDEDFIGLRKEIWDQQIVDVEGIRVVRVNDLKIGLFGTKMCVLGIDISIKGILRRLGMEWLDIFDALKVNLIDWRQAQPVKGFLKLDILSDSLNHLHPADLANIVEDLSLNNGSELVRSLDSKDAAKVLEEIEPNLQKVMVEYIGPEESSDIIEEMSIDEIADLMKTFPKHKADKFMEQLKKGVARKVEKLIRYSDDTAGGLMSMDYIVVRPDWTVSDAIEEIKEKSATHRSVLYVYVVDKDGRFLGTVSLRWLIISSNNKKMQDLVKNYPISSTLKPEDEMKDIIEIMTKYDLFTAAVLDENQKLLGVVSIDDVMRDLAPDA